MMSYYDGLLLAIPTILLIGPTVSISIGVPVQLSISIASTIVLTLIIHGTIIRPPTPHQTTNQQQETTIQTKPSKIKE